MSELQYNVFSELNMLDSEYNLILKIATFTDFIIDMILTYTYLSVASSAILSKAGSGEGSNWLLQATMSAGTRVHA